MLASAVRVAHKLHCLRPHVAVMAATEHDKKNTGSARIMVLPREIGRCEVVSGIEDDDLRYGLAAIGIA